MGFTPDRVIPELTFGFWNSLLDSRYERLPAHCLDPHARPLWPFLLKPVFPHAPRYLRTRAQILTRLNAIRKLRNRVFHHETIWHHPNLNQVYAEIMEAIDWISPEMEQMIRAVDGFSIVCDINYMNSLKTVIQQIK